MCPNFGASAGSTSQGTRNIRKKLGVQNVCLHVHAHTGMQIINCWGKKFSGYLNLDLKSTERGRAEQCYNHRAASLIWTQC